MSNPKPDGRLWVEFRGRRTAAKEYEVFALIELWNCYVAMWNNRERNPEWTLQDDGFFPFTSFANEPLGRRWKTLVVKATGVLYEIETKDWTEWVSNGRPGWSGLAGPWLKHPIKREQIVSAWRREKREHTEDRDFEHFRSSTDSKVTWLGKAKATP